MPIVKHLNLLVYFIKKSRGATHSAIVRLGVDFDLAVSFTVFNSIKTNPKSKGFMFLRTALPADSRV